MPDLRVAIFPDGVAPPAQLALSGGSPSVFEDVNGSRSVRYNPFAINWIAAGGEIALHFNARPDQQTVVLNSFLDGRWGDEVVIKRYPFRTEPDLTFGLLFEVLSERFRISVEDEHLCDFVHRIPPDALREVRSTTFLWRLDNVRLSLVQRLRGQRGRAVPPVVVPSAEKSISIQAQENPLLPDRLGSVRFFAILGTWMEEDIVEATVANALRQGCERIYLVDNASSDATVERAVAAGAIVARVFEHDRYDEFVRIRHMEAVTEEVSADTGAKHVWWLWLDADEFHHGPRGLTLREYLATLDGRFRVVGARFFNHLPSGSPAYVEAKHPLDFQPLCYEIAVPSCDLGHSNHPLQRWDRGGAPISCGIGRHKVSCREPLIEPTAATFFHHFPFRSEGATRRRISHLTGSDGNAANRIGDEDNLAAAHMRLRLRSLDAVYRQRWGDVSFFPPCARGYVPELRPWEEWVSREDSRVARWY